jgi:hypothetical protein
MSDGYVSPIAAIPKPVITSTTKPADAANQLAQYISGVAGASLDTFDHTAHVLTGSAADGNDAAQIFMQQRIKSPDKIEKPNYFIPPAPDRGLLVIDFDAALVQVKGVVDGLQSSWLMKYFPAAMPDGVDALLTQISSGTLVTAAMQEIFWERAKYQTARDAARYEDEAVTSWASRGFALPGGVINKQIARKNQELFNANADLAAQQAIKGLEIQIDAVKFAAEISTKLRLGLISGITGLVEAYSKLPTAAATYAQAVSEAQRASYAAIVEYYKLLIERSNLTVSIDEKNITNYLTYAELESRFIAQFTNSHIQAVSQASDAYARTAAGAITGINSVTQIGIQSAV